MTHDITAIPRNVPTKAPMMITASCILESTLSTNGLTNLSNLTGTKPEVLDNKSIKDKDGSHKKYQDKKREQAQLKTTISELLTKKSGMEASIASIITD